MNFSEALKHLKEGRKIARAGWNDKGMHLQLVKYYRVTVSGESLESKGIAYAPWIGMKAADNTFVPWLASQTDLLAEDWQLLPCDLVQVYIGD